jgi:hypothetical protein
MIEDALRYQTEGEDWVKRVVIGGLMSFLAFLVIPVFTFNGYMIDVARRVLRGETTTPPAWEELDLVETTIDGVKQFVIIFVYSFAINLVSGLPFIIFIAIAAGLDSGILFVVGLLVTGFLFFLGSLLLAILAPIVTVNFVLEDSISAGFDVAVIRKLFTNRTMLKTAGLGLVINILVVTVSFLLGAIIIGVVFAPFVGFIGQSAVFYVWASGFGDAYRQEFGELPPVPESPIPDDGVGTLGDLLDSGDSGTTAGESATATTTEEGVTDSESVMSDNVTDDEGAADDETTTSDYVTDDETDDTDRRE